MKEVPEPTDFVLESLRDNLRPIKKAHLYYPSPTNLVFYELADLYCDRFEVSNAGLAQILEISPQSCSQWKTGSGGRSPTWAKLIWLCNAVNCQIIVDGDGMRVARRRKRRS
ncbi:MAG: hypothetical protein CMA63_06790 [Euryarchaeota archaeon]|nr:hypothetical protein [Euryarchaeota archaeon]